MSSSRVLSKTATGIALAASISSFSLIGWALTHSGRNDALIWGGAVALLVIAGVAAGFAIGRRGNELEEEEEPEQEEGAWIGPSRQFREIPEIYRQEAKAQEVIEKLGTARLREEMNKSLAELRAERERPMVRVVVFGTGSAGKTSLINALIGREVGATDPVMGTTERGEFHNEVIEGVEGTVILTDTPGLSEFGQEGESREREARELAETADLILFVLDHDLVRTEFDILQGLAALRKRLIVILNKIDRFTDEDRAAIVAKLRDRLKGKVPPEDVVAIAASPRPIPVRVVQPDGSTEIHYEAEEPDVSELEGRLAKILEREGSSLRAANLLLRTRRLERKAAEALVCERRAKARAVVEKYQWIAAGSVFASPTAAINLAAGGTAHYQMVNELSQVFGAEASPSRNRSILAQLMATLLKLGLGEAATTLIAGLFKTTLIGFAAAGAVQAVTMAYLTRISGLALIEYFEKGQTWGAEGINQSVLRQFDATSRTEFLQDFVKQAVKKLADRAGMQGGSGTGQS